MSAFYFILSFESSDRRTFLSNGTDTLPSGVAESQSRAVDEDSVASEDSDDENKKSYDKHEEELEGELNDEIEEEVNNESNEPDQENTALEDAGTFSEKGDMDEKEEGEGEIVPGTHSPSSLVQNSQDFNVGPIEVDTVSFIVPAVTRSHYSQFALLRANWSSACGTKAGMRISQNAWGLSLVTLVQGRHHRARERLSKLDLKPLKKGGARGERG